MKAVKQKRFSNQEKRAILAQFRSKPSTEDVPSFAKRMGVAVPTLYGWRSRAKPRAQHSNASPRRVITRRAGRPLLDLPPPEKLSETQRLALENSILRGLIRIARSEGFVTSVDLALGLARG